MENTKKLSQINQSMLLTGLKYAVLIKNLNKIFALTEEATDKVNNLFVSHKIDDKISLHDNIANIKLAHTLRTQYKQSEKGNVEYSATNLPFHVSDYDWLANYILAVTQKNEPEMLVTIYEIKRFIQDSPEFKQARLDYEKKIINRSISNNMKMFIRDASKTAHDFKSRNVYPHDEAFRNKTICMMNVLGVEHHLTELELETNGHLWRKRVMERIFNESYPKIGHQKNNSDGILSIRMRNTLKKQWLKLREYNYYRQHKSIIDEAGTITDSMKISQFDWLRLSQEVADYKDMYSQLLKAPQNTQTNINDKKEIS